MPRQAVAPDHRLAQKLIMPLTIISVFWTLAFLLWRSSGNPFWLLNFGYLGTAVGGGLMMYSFLQKKRKPLGRKVAQALVALYMLGFLGFHARENMQIEGFFFYLLSGFFGAAVLHYLVAKVIGPLIFNRGWCAWACWTAMLLDVLPYNRSPGWAPGRWKNLRYLTFAASLLLVMILALVYGYDSALAARPVWWLVTGNGIYYAAAITLAIALKDNRAFCKYLCPVAVPLKLGSRFSLLKIRGDASKCTDCKACSRMCPMNVDIPAYVRAGQRVLSSECSLCQTCTTVCSTGSLSLSFGFDVGFREKLVVRRRVTIQT